MDLFTRRELKMRTTPPGCSVFLIVLIWLTIVRANEQTTCIVELESGQIVKHSVVKCRQSTLELVTKSLATLIPTDGQSSPLGVNVSGVDIAECDIHTLPNLFVQFKDTADRVRVANSLVQFVAGNAFTGFENRLKYLDLSGNRLITIPSAIQILTRLQVLDIRDNHIRVIPPDFTRSALQELHASFNYLGFSEGGPAGLLLLPMTKNVPRLQIAEDILDLTSVASTLELIDLSFNGLHVIPKQLLDKQSNFLPRLRILSLSGNRISDIPISLIENLPDLQTLQLDSNLIRTIKLDPFPSNIKLLTLRDNPLQCNCDVMWLLELLRRNSTLTVRLPSCSTPFYLRDLTLANLNDQRLCPTPLQPDDTPQSPHVVYVTDGDLASFHLGLFQSLHLMDVQGEVQALFISWKVDPDFYAFPNLEWAVILRPFDSNIYDFELTQFTLANYQKNQPAKEGSIYSDSVQGLTPQRFYLVCITAVDSNIYYVHFNNCKGATTLQEPPQSVHTSFPTPITTPLTSPQPKTKPLEIEFNVNAEASSDTIDLKWTVYDQEPVWLEEKVKSPLNFNALFTRPNYVWRIELRLFGSQTLYKNEMVTDSADVLNPTQNHTSGTKIVDVEPNSAYFVCVTLVQTPSQKLQSKVQEKEECLEVSTKAKELQTYSKAQMATAAVASAASAGICTALVALCINFKNRQKPEEEVEQTPLPISDLLQRSSSIRIIQGPVSPVSTNPTTSSS